MDTHHRYPHGVKSARELVALTVVIYRWHRDYLLALAHERECTPSALLRVLLDSALGPAPTETAARESSERAEDEPPEPAPGRSIRLEPRHRAMLAAIAERRALSISALLKIILDAWGEAQLQAED